MQLFFWLLEQTGYPVEFGESSYLHCENSTTTASNLHIHKDRAQ